MKPILFSLLIFLFTSCSTPTKHHLLYPIEASKQKISRLEGYRFLSSTHPSPASILVLSNPVEDNGFVDFAFAMTNNSAKTVHLHTKDFVFKLSKKGDLSLLPLAQYAKASEYKRPKKHNDLTPKMKAYGCAGDNTKDNISPSQFNAAQAWVWKKYLQYPFKRQDLYVQDLEIKPQETKGLIWRLKIPSMGDDFKKGTMYIKFNADSNIYRFKFILQSLKETH